MSCSSQKGAGIIVLTEGAFRDKTFLEFLSIILGGYFKFQNVVGPLAHELVSNSDKHCFDRHCPID